MHKGHSKAMTDSFRLGEAIKPFDVKSQECESSKIPSTPESFTPELIPALGFI